MDNEDNDFHSPMKDISKNNNKAKEEIQVA